jgi:hypothetical protein
MNKVNISGPLNKISLQKYKIYNIFVTQKYVFYSEIISKKDIRRRELIANFLKRKNILA